MQLQIRIDERNSFTLQLKLQGSASDGSAHGPEVVAAVITESNLLDISKDAFLDIIGQSVDHLTAVAPPAPTGADDWRDKFRSGEL